MNAAPPEESAKPAASAQKSKLKRSLAFAGLLLIAALAALVTLLAAKWPFTRDAMTKRLEHHGMFKVTIGRFHSTYFPPGCVADDVTFRRGSETQRNGGPLLTIRRLTVQASYSGMFSHPKHVQKLIADEAKASLSQFRSRAEENGSNPQQPGEALELGSSGNKIAEDKSSGKKTSVSVIVDELMVRNSVLVLDQKPVYALNIHELRLLNLDPKKTVPFSVVVHIPKPDAEISANGWIGPEADEMRDTPLSGAYKMEGELGVFKAITGKLASRGQLHGSLDALDAEGATESPNFGVKESAHRMRLNTRFRATVDLKTGDIRIPDLNAQLGATELQASAAIATKARTVQLNVSRGQGDVQDLLNLFSHNPRPPMTGPIAFQTRITLPLRPKRPFKERVLLAGDFNINPARFTSGHTQLDVDKLSAKARGNTDKAQKKSNKAKHARPETEDPSPVLSNLQGHVELKDGVARLSRLSFSVPGATARMAGTYNLVDKRVDLHGKMSMQAKLSQATSGVKSFFLKILDPFFRKKKAGAVIPVAMTGRYGHTHFSVGPGK